MSQSVPRPLEDLIEGWSVEPVLSGEAGATVLRLTRSDAPARYLKFGRGRIADDVADEAHRLFWLHGRLPCATPLHFMRGPDDAWLLTEAVAGRTGDDWIAHDPAMLPAVIHAFATFLRRLHALPIADCPFDAGADVRLAHARRLIDGGMVDHEDFDPDHAGWSADQMWERLVALRPAVRHGVVTHGDYSLGNVLIDATGVVTGCIDVGRLGVADRYQDIAILWQNLREFGDDAAARFLTGYGIAALDRERLEFHRCLDELF